MFFISVFVIILGLSIGSFINCLVWRLHEEKSLSGRSMCPKCKQKIAWFDNIPVLSFVLLKARCRNCKKFISFEYPLVEIVVCLLFFASFYMSSSGMVMSELLSLDFFIINLRNFFIISVLVVIFIIDFKWYLILDRVTIPAIIIVFLLNLLTGMSWSSMLISGIIGGSFFLIQFLISGGKWIGGGDIRLGFLMGVILAWPNILVALFIAYVLGSLIGVFLIIIGKKKMGSLIPFGVFLTISTYVSMFWGNDIASWYLNLLY